MIPAILLTGIAAGTVAAIWALVAGFGVLAALGFYVLAGTGCGLALGAGGWLCHMRHRQEPQTGARTADI